MTPRRRVVIVDDDPLLLKLVAMCVEHQPIELVSCTSVAEAVAAMRAMPAQLVVTDLMMPGESGFDLLARLRDEPGLAPGARVVVFSASLQAPARQQLDRWGVWRVLEKPLAMRELNACIDEALAGMPGPQDAQDAQEAEIARRHFAGDVEMLQAFRSECLRQFPRDLADGTAALGRGDLHALRLVAHNLKSVLRLLGDERGSTRAAQAEAAAATGDTRAAAQRWQAVRRAVESLCTRHATSGAAAPGHRAATSRTD